MRLGSRLGSFIQEEMSWRGRSGGGSPRFVLLPTATHGHREEKARSDDADERNGKDDENGLNRGPPSFSFGSIHQRQSGCR